MGGREVLHAAISSDNAKTWKGFRDVLHETMGPAGGDSGTSYASGVETKDGKICFASGQGEGKRAIVLFDPDWLTETSVKDEVDPAPVFWNQFGDEGLVAFQEGISIPLKSSGLCGASWNFPASTAGRISFRLWWPPEATEGSLSLSDHFSRIDDAKAAENSAYRFAAGADNGMAAGRWQEVEVRWNHREAELFVEGRRRAVLPIERPAVHGLNYLRIEARSAGHEGGIKIAEINLQAD